MQATEIEERLPHFFGSQTFTRWSIWRNSVLTEGTLYLAQEAKAYWLFDAIQSHIDQINDDAIQSVLTINDDGTAILVINDMDENVLATQNFEYTTFPLKTIKIWSMRNELGGHTHMLPSEY